MKVAVFVYGMYREFDVAVKSWDFLFKMDCDFYFSTWSKSTILHYPTNTFIEKPVTMEMITNHIPNAKVELLDENSYMIDNKNGYENVNNKLVNSEKMIHHWKNCLKMCKNSGIKYDQIILMRPDGYFLLKFPYENLKKFNRDNVLYGKGPGVQIDYDLTHVIDDVFFIGSESTISRFIETTPSKLNKISGNGIHNELSESILLNKFFHINIIGFVSYIIRPNIIELNNTDMNEENLNLKLYEWAQKKESISFLNNIK
jgi:hypothetical protein